jgi:uncharacterized protein (TIGR00730 family)
VKKKLSELDSNGKDHFRVAIFGSARIKKSDKNYRLVKKLGMMLGERGIDVVTGGGPGLMKAANVGHKEGSGKTKAHSIGLGIRLPFEQEYNKGVQYSKMFERFSKRLDQFMLLSNAIVVAPGGIGTLLEAFYAWQLVQVNHVCHVPIIFLGDEWPGLLKWMKEVPLKRKYFKKKDMDLAFQAKNCDEAIKIIDMTYEGFKKGGKNFCLNSKKYRV